MREPNEGIGRQERDLVCGLVLSDGRSRPKRLNKVPERAELDDENFAPWRSRWARDQARPGCRQSIEIDKIREFLEGFEYGRVLLQVGCIDAGD